MKVLIIAPWFFVEMEAIFIRQQVKELQRRGCEVGVISPTPWVPFPLKHLSKKWKGYSEIPAKMIWEGIEVHYPRSLVFPRNLFFASSGKRMYLAIRKLTDKLYQDFQFDIIHARMAFPHGYAAMLLSKRYNKPLVTTFRGTDLDITIHRNRQCFDAIHRVCENSAKIIVPSPHLRETLRQQMGASCEVISHGIRNEDIFTGSTSLSKRYEGRSIILSVSRLWQTKGISLNLRAIAELREKYPGISYLIIGEGEERARFERLVEDLNLQSKVEFLDQLPHQKVMEYMSICDIFCLPSWQETLGLVYLEAMAHGKPVIGCQGQGVDGIVVEGETGFLARPGDVDSLVEAISFLLDNPLKAKAIGEQARRLVLENYTWQKNVERTMSLYREVQYGERL